MAMQRKKQDISVHFGSQGSRELKADLQSIGAAMGKLKGAGISMLDSLKIGAGVQVFSSAWDAAVRSLDLTSDQYVDSISRLSNVTGTTLGEMSRLAGVARRFGVDIGDLRGSMVQFFGQVSAAARGDSVAEEFEKIGISSQFLAENLDDPLKILLSVAKAQKSLTGATRTGILGRLFGEDDSAKVGDMLNALGGDAKEVAEALKEIDASGAVVTDKDVKTNREFMAAMAEFDDVFRGLRLELGRGILPTISKLTDATSGWLRTNRGVVTGTILGAWEHVGGAIGDVVNYLTIGRDAVRGTWLYPVAGWFETLGKAAGTAGRIFEELFDALGGTRTTREFKWIDGLAAGLKGLGGLSVAAIDGAFAVVGGTMTASLDLLGQLPGAVEATKSAWNEFSQGFSGTVTGTGLAELGGLLGDLYHWTVGLKDALVDIATGQPVDAQFAWVKAIVDSAPDLLAAIRQMGDVGDIMRTVGESFDLIAAMAVPVGIAAGALVAVFGGIGLAAGLAAIAVGAFIAKMAESQQWLKAPFDAVDNFFREISGANEAQREFEALLKSTGEASYDAWLRQRPADAPPITVPVQPVADDLQADVTLTPQIDPQAIQDAVDQAQLQISGAIAMSQFPGQITSATTASDTAVRRAAAGTQQPAPTGIPIIIQLTPGGKEVTVYAKDENEVQILLDSYASAKRASATPGGLPFAGGRR